MTKIKGTVLTFKTLNGIRVDLPELISAEWRCSSADIHAFISNSHPGFVALWGLFFHFFPLPALVFGVVLL